MKNKRIYISALCIALAVITCLSLAGCSGSNVPAETTTTAATTTTPNPSGSGNGNTPTSDPEYTPSLLALIDLLFEKFSIYDIDRDTAMLAAVKAYVEATGDKYAVYYSDEEWREYATENNGDLYGIGVTVVFDYTQNCIEVVSIVPGSPAEKYLKVGDFITHFYSLGKFFSVDETVDKYYEKYKEIYPDDESILLNARYDAYQEILSNIKGEIGTIARIKVDRGGEEHTFFIERAKVKTQSVIYKISKTDPSVGIVWINSFDLVAPAQFKEAMDALIASGVNKFVFDVRENPGGNVASVSAVLSTLLQEGDVILSTKDSNGKSGTTVVHEVTYDPPENDKVEDYSSCSVAKGDIGKYRGYDMVVLANENSASAAELFTAALRDYGLAEIVGVKTFGKGSMQSLVELSAYGEDYPGVLRFTTKLYFPPCGEGYDGGIGIQPDHYVDLSEEAKKLNFYKLNEENDDQLKKAISVLLNID